MSGQLQLSSQHRETSGGGVMQADAGGAAVQKEGVPYGVRCHISASGEHTVAMGHNRV